MKKYKIEVSKSCKAIVFMELIIIFSMCIWSSFLSYKAQDLNIIATVPIFFLFSWAFIRVFFINITICNDYFRYNIFNHSKLMIPFKDIILARQGNEHDYIERGYPVFSKNVIVIEYFSYKKKKKVVKKFYFSLKPEDSVSFMEEIKNKCGNFVI